MLDKSLSGACARSRLSCSHAISRLGSAYTRALELCVARRGRGELSCACTTIVHRSRARQGGRSLLALLLSRAHHAVSHVQSSICESRVRSITLTQHASGLRDGGTQTMSPRPPLTNLRLWCPVLPCTLAGGGHAQVCAGFPPQAARRGRSGTNLFVMRDAPG